MVSAVSRPVLSTGWLPASVDMVEAWERGMRRLPGK
jgi:DNA-binding transcriptional regulator YiaG